MNNSNRGLRSAAFKSTHAMTLSEKCHKSPVFIHIHHNFMLILALNYILTVSYQAITFFSKNFMTKNFAPLTTLTQTSIHTLTCHFLQIINDISIYNHIIIINDILIT